MRGPNRERMLAGTTQAVKAARGWGEGLLSDHTALLETKPYGLSGPFTGELFLSKGLRTGLLLAHSAQRLLLA